MVGSLGRWRSPLGWQTPVCFGKLSFEDIIPVQGLVGLQERTSSHVIAWQTDLHEGSRECSWGAGEEVGVLVLSFAPRLHLCIASLHPHCDVLVAEQGLDITLKRFCDFSTILPEMVYCGVNLHLPPKCDIQPCSATPCFVGNSMPLIRLITIIIGM